MNQKFYDGRLLGGTLVFALFVYWLILSGCRPYRPCRLPTGERITRADAEILRNQGVTVICSEDE